MTRGGPVNATHLMATLLSEGDSGGQLGEGAAISTAMIPFLLAAIGLVVACSAGNGSRVSND